MSDTGFTKFTAFFRGDSGAQGGGKFPSGESRILTMSAEMRAEASTIRAGLKLRGEVIQENSDRSVRVRTERGELDILPPENRSAPRKGAEVEVYIQPQPAKSRGKPPEAADIRIIRQPEAGRGDYTPVDLDLGAPEREPQRFAARMQQQANAALSRAQASLERLATQVTKPPETTQGTAPATLSPEGAKPLPAAPSSTPPPATPEYYMQGLPVIGSTVRLIPLPAAQVLPAPDLPPPVLAQPASAALVENAFTPISSPQTGEIQNALALSVSSAQTAPSSLTAFLQAPENTAFVPANVGAFFTQPATPQLADFTPFTTTPGLTTPQASAFTAPLAFPITNNGLTVEAPITAKTLPALTPLKNLDVKLNAILPPQDAPQLLKTLTVPDMMKAGQMEGVVTGISEGKLPHISIHFPQTGESTLFALQQPSGAGVTIGARMILTPQSSPAAPLLPDLQSASSLPLPPLPILTAPAASWPILDEVQQTLNHIAPQAAQVMSSVMPNAANPAQLAPAIMFFVAAVRGGDLGSWMGERGVEALSKNHKGLLDRLLGEGNTLSRISAEVAQNDWRALNIPIAYQEHAQKMALYYRHERDDAEDAPKGARGTRFVFDLALDKMGKVQVDGLFRPVSSEGQRLDLIVRTGQAFSEATRAEMRRVYASALKSSGVAGSLDFQGALEGWVTINAQGRDALGVDA